ncbi:hypothetical protein [Moraxella sp. ZY210820]|uniref:hypothetical protein n=1 Tax=unclassified Moraxella TaxID=2685852 RepID=UPI002730162A|nr:hypothetical protein [Moraxella sp. ZY210820]WLF83678.1 hypothetical protein LU301_10540 [Moraxella sp. ZY210820]
MHDDLVSYYQQFEMSRAKAVEPKILQKYKANKARDEALAQQSNNLNINELFDDDVLQILAQLQTNAKEKQVINRLIRAVYA